MAAIGEHRAQTLIDDATKVGLTADQIAAHVRVRPQDLYSCSGADATRIEQLINDAAERRQLVEAFVDQCVRFYGKAESQARQAVQHTSVEKLRQAVAANDTDLRRRGIDTRTDAEKQADAAAHAARPATDGQVDYLVKLLGRRSRSGEGGGFMSTSGLYDQAGNVDRGAVEALTAQQANQLLDSLTGRY